MRLPDGRSVRRHVDHLKKCYSNSPPDEDTNLDESIPLVFPDPPAAEPSPAVSVPAQPVDQPSLPRRSGCIRHPPDRYTPHSGRGKSVTFAAGLTD